MASYNFFSSAALVSFFFCSFLASKAALFLAYSNFNFAISVERDFAEVLGLDLTYLSDDGTGSSLGLFYASMLKDSVPAVC